MSPGECLDSIVIALGGNALEDRDAPDSVFRGIVQLIKSGKKVVITHGNGPQVGRLYNLSASDKSESLGNSLDVCVADTQGGIGYMLQNILRNLCLKEGIEVPIVALVTQVIVDQNDSAFLNPSKPIGSFVSEVDARALREAYGWEFKRQVDGRQRRVVPSPKPKKILEATIIRKLVDANITVICCGGGGIPVTCAGGFTKGIEAVIDKDYTTALLANDLNAHTCLFLTNVKNVFLQYKKSGQSPLLSTTTDELKKYLQLGHFYEGSMKPKVEAAINFIEQGGKKAIIAHLSDMDQAMEGRVGTHVTGATNG